ncbi:FUSC family membrane protein [Undibacterium sp. TJN25]|uniref:FUSC family membrane protein n=1 Tax=Undibacterium sp. TJN25 TaxID=3413056 RepID=UPI003BF16522
MHYALDLRTFIFSHYFYTGFRIAIGVIGLTSLVLAYADLPTAMTVCIGALCTSLMDMPSPLRHKFNEMLSSVLLCTAVTLIISLCAPFNLLLSIMLVIISFLASMMVVYGKKTMPLQFAALFVMTLSMENELSAREAFLHSGLFLAGGLSYMTYSMVVSWFLRNRIRQQILAEALFELTRYIDIKAGFYDTSTDLNEQFNLAVRQQILLADKQQASRDLLLRGKQSEQDSVLVQVHFRMLDLYELVLATHTDYVVLRRYLADTDVLDLLHQMVDKAARDIESVAYSITRKRASYSEISYREDMEAIEKSVVRLEQDSRDGKLPEEALTALRSSLNKLRDVVDMIGQLHLATQAPAAPMPMLPDADMTPFLTQQRYALGVMLSNMSWTSPTFRFSIRVALAITVGLLIADHLPYAAHGYWIVLTIVIILKPSFSMTKQRRSDRLIGTVIGCVVTSVILHFVHAPVLLLGFLFLATAAVPAFLYIKYRYAAVAATMQILLQINLLVPTNAHVVSERLTDTLIGAIIATLFSFVLPSWEYRALPQLVKNVLADNQRYIIAARDLLQARITDDFVYRISRKRLMDSLAGLSSALVRMLDEPESKRRAVEDINLFVVQNYLVIAHVASLRLLLRRHVRGQPSTYVNSMLEDICARVWDNLARAQQRWDAIMPSKVSAVESKVEGTFDVDYELDPANPEPGVQAWSGWRLLQRRSKLIAEDANKIVIHSTAIAHNLVNVED